MDSIDPKRALIAGTFSSTICGMVASVRRSEVSYFQYTTQLLSIYHGGQSCTKSKPMFLAQYLHPTDLSLRAEEEPIAKHYLDNLPLPFIQVQDVDIIEPLFVFGSSIQVDGTNCGVVVCCMAETSFRLWTLSSSGVWYWPLTKLWEKRICSTQVGTALL